MAFFRQVRLLMWKHVLHKWRKKFVSVVEIVLPLTLALVWMSIRAISEKYQHEPASYFSRRCLSRFPKFNQQHAALYTPNTTLIKQLIMNISNSGHQQSSKLPPIMGFESSEHMLTYFTEHSNEVLGALEFLNIRPQDSSLPRTLRFAVRLRGDTWKTHKTFPSEDQWRPRRFAYPEYRRSGFLYIQRLIYEGVINYWNPNATAILKQMEICLQRMPYPPYDIDNMSRLFQEFFPISLMLSFIFIAVQSTKDIVEEKERKLKESMKMMGLSAAAHWTSWFLFRFIQVAIIMALFTAVCGADMSGKEPHCLNLIR